MLKKEYYTTKKDKVKLYKTYSNENKMIRQIETNVLYDEAIDVENAPYTYEETNIDINDFIKEREDNHHGQLI